MSEEFNDIMAAGSDDFEVNSSDFSSDELTVEDFMDEAPTIDKPDWMTPGYPVPIEEVQELAAAAMIPDPAPRGLAADGSC